MKKIYSVVILFFLLSYNLAFGLLSFISFIQNQNVLDVSQISIQNQYKAFSSMPKEFINICIEVSNELSLSTIFKDKVANIVADTNMNFNSNNCALLYSNPKLKKNSTEYNNYADKKTSCYGLFFCCMLFCCSIFYLTRYIGLLYLFGKLNIKKYFVIGKLCLYCC